MPELHTIHFNITRNCNLACVFCYNNAVRKQKDNLTIDIIRHLASDAADSGCRRVILSGGEPLMRRDWKDVARVFDQRGMEVSLATNGTLISDEAINFLLTLEKPTLSISLDGGRHVHNRLRGSDTAFQRTIKGLAKIRASTVPFHVNTVICRENISELGTLAKIARDFNCAVRLTLLHNNGRAREADATGFSADEILYLREYCHILRRHGVNIFMNLPPLLQYLDEIIPSRGAACGWGVNFCGVLANGDVTVCGVASDEPQLVAGNILHERFIDIWRNSRLFSQTRSLDVRALKGICGKCPFNDYCGGACRLSAYRSSGDFLAPYQLCQSFYEAGYIPEALLKSAGVTVPDQGAVVS